jgi:hypothetical protein
MRSSKLITALVAASALLVLAPAGAGARPAAHKHASASVKGSLCKVSLVAEPRTLTAGETVELTGQLLCTSGSTVGQTITVFQRTAGSPSFKSIATTATAAEGLFKFTTPTVSVDSWFYVAAPTRRSPTRAVKVAPVVKLKGPEPETVPLETGKKHAVTFSGSVNPSDEGAEVWLEREQATSSEEWGVIQKGVVKAGGVFTLLHTFTIPGDANIRAVVRPHGIFDVRGTSNQLSYVINQTQNPNLTIKSSADPISYGASITIEGVLKGGAGKTITLLSHAKGVKTFSPAGPTAVAGPSGEYKFVLTPLINTFYRVSGGGQNSAVVVEGVKYLLTAGVTSTKVMAGQPLTFSGTVTPAHAKKTVYLERENLFGGGFHVAEVAEVLFPSGTYAIPYVFHGSGKQVFRVHVPGDPENQGTSSSTFTIEVAPSPPTLHPVVRPEKQPR